MRCARFAMVVNTSAGAASSARWSAARLRRPRPTLLHLKVLPSSGSVPQPGVVINLDPHLLQSQRRQSLVVERVSTRFEFANPAISLRDFALKGLRVYLLEALDLSPEVVRRVPELAGLSPGHGPVVSVSGANERTLTAVDGPVTRRHHPRSEPQQAGSPTNVVVSLVTPVRGQLGSVLEKQGNSLPLPPRR